jgi:hypothetical protein
MAKEDCGTKHLTLALWIIGLVAVFCLGTLAYAAHLNAAMDSRVRTVEQSAAATDARFEAIQQSLKRIETKIDK